MDSNLVGEEDLDLVQPPPNEQAQPLQHLIDAVDGQKNVQKKCSALNHFRCFLKKWYREKKLTLEDDFNDTTHLDDDMFGKYSTYLANHATLKYKEGAALLSYNAAYGYLSATKSYFINKFRNLRTPAVFENCTWGKYMSSVHKAKAAIARSQNKVSHTLNVL